MKCYLCNYEPLDVHDTENTYVTYCQQCGTTTEAQRSHPRRFAEIKKLPTKANNRGSGQIIPLADRRAKRR